MPKKSTGNQPSATLDDIFEVVTFIKDNAVTREEFKQEVSSIRQEASSIRGEISQIKATMATKEELSQVREDLNQVKATIATQMVTKDYLDQKIADLRADLIVMMRRADIKLKTLAELLHDKKVLNRADVRKVYSLEPFAQQI